MLAHACPCNKQSYYVVRTAENPVSYNGIIAQTLKGIGSIFFSGDCFFRKFFFWARCLETSLNGTATYTHTPLQLTNPTACGTSGRLEIEGVPEEEEDFIVSVLTCGESGLKSLCLDFPP